MCVNISPLLLSNNITMNCDIFLKMDYLGGAEAIYFWPINHAGSYL
jgi:hypothetical protein